MAGKILVTGGSGYLGSILVPELLDKGYGVTVLDNLMYDQSSLLQCCVNPKFEFIRGDICDHTLVNKILPRFDIIIPLAAIVGAPACKLSPTVTRLVNNDAHRNLVENISPS